MVDFGQLQDLLSQKPTSTMATQQLHQAIASNAAGRCQVGSIVPCGRVGHSAMDKAHRGQQCVHPINSQSITR
ncbi:hypothetical protein T08_8573 [Trichinella sp. T8]|nr:hypothetical protein T08_8573 [Trichinella sp. T8]